LYIEEMSLKALYNKYDFCCKRACFL